MSKTKGNQNDKKAPSTGSTKAPSDYQAGKSATNKVEPPTAKKK